MTNFNSNDILQVFEQVKAENTTSIKLMLLEDQLDKESFVVALSLLAHGIFTRPIRVTYNTYDSEDDFADIVRYFHGDKTRIPMQTLRVLAYLANPQLLRVTRGEVLDLLEEVPTINIYAMLGKPVSKGCALCGDTCNGNLCDYCAEVIEDFTKFRTDSFIATLTPNNYKRCALLTSCELHCKARPFVVHIKDNILTFVRRDPIPNAQLPIEEFMRDLS